YDTDKSCGVAVGVEPNGSEDRQPLTRTVAIIAVTSIDSNFRDAIRTAFLHTRSGSKCVRNQ
ncbi:MAG: hypothetical protein ACXW1R_08090, partial [Halobacteriota archaeon]